jgi:hypothetical protein
MIVISKNTDSVYKDKNTIFDLGLTIPADVIQLYFDGTRGWIEKSNGQRENITALPNWANECLSIYETAVGPTPPELIQ